MANVYVRSGAAGAGTGADWANAYTTLAAALAAKAAGDSFWVSEDHAESQASAMTLTSPGTAANPCFIYCVDHLGSIPPVSADLRTTATITTTGGNNITTSGSFYCDGVILQCGSGATTAALSIGNAVNHFQKFKNCSLRVLSTTAATLNLGAARNEVILDNVTYQTGVATGVITLASKVTWKNTPSAILGTAPTNLFGSFSAGAVVTLEAVDLSAMGSGKNLLSANSTAGILTLKDCKFGASVTATDAPSQPSYPIVTVLRSDSAAANYRCERYLYAGTETTETTIVRTAGASDGVTAQSRKIATTANARWVLPFEAIPISVYVDVAGVPYTAVLEGTINAAAVPKNDEIWLDVEYLGSASNPQGSVATGTKADNLAAGSNLAASTASWAGGGSGAGWSPFQLSVTFTPQMAGWVTLYVKAAKVSTTYYIDPRPTGLNVVKTYMAGAGGPMVINERDLADTSLDAIETGIVA